MLIDFTIKNYRSIRDEYIFSLECNTSKKKKRNWTSVELPNDQKINLLKSAIIFGPNAAGKSNLLRGLFIALRLIYKTADLKRGDKLNDYTSNDLWYDPFRFNNYSFKHPTKFEFTFLKRESNEFHKVIKYRYEVVFNNDEIIMETLDFYPLGRPANIYTKKVNNPLQLSSKYFLDKRDINKSILDNRLVLSEIGGTTAHKQLGEVYDFFKSVFVFNTLTRGHKDTMRRMVSRHYINPKNEWFRKRLSRLIQVADTKIDSLYHEQNPIDSTEKNKDDQKIKKTYAFYGKHKIFDESNNEISDDNKLGLLPFGQESEGTKMLFEIGGMVLITLDIGGILVIDEFNNSLHPLLCNFLISLFHNEKTNKKNAQFIVASHDASLLDKKLFRKDQIWFTQKDNQGSTELYSVADFHDVRDDTSFDQWYAKGKFGGRPNIKEIEYIFSE